MSIFTRGRERRERIAELERQSAELRLANNRFRAASRVVDRLLSRSARGSMTSELYQQMYPDANKYSGALSLYRSFWSSSNDQLRRLSRIAAFESPTGAAMIERMTDVVVGSGLRLQAEPLWDLVVFQLQQQKRISSEQASRMLDPEWQRLWRKNVEQRYRIWAKSLQPSYDNAYNLYQIDRQCFRYLLEDGEYFLVFRYAATGRTNPLTVQIIPAENIRGGETAASGNTIENGIEYDPRGAAVAYHIWDAASGGTKRIPRFGPKSSRIFVVHTYLKTRETQRRGIPYLANIVHELTKLGDYEVLEIQAAIVNALFAVWVKPPAEEDGQPTIGAGASRRSSSVAAEDAADPTIEYLAKTEHIDFSHGGVIVDALPAGHELQSFDTKRPNQGFDNFFGAVKKNIAAAKGIPLAVVDLAFNNSYSGARGELLMFWMHVEQLRTNHGWDFEDDVYKMWMWGEIDRGRIEAPGFESDDLLREAYANAQWIGNQRPDIDPEKSVRANVIEQKYGYSTGHKITAERGGGDYEENLQVIGGELKKVAAANAAMKGLEDSNRSGAAAGTGGQE
jgi:lambda family phage portal protein